MFGRKEAFHGSADTAVNTSQHVCIDIRTSQTTIIIFLNNFSSKQIILHIHGFNFKTGKTVANILYLHT